MKVEQFTVTLGRRERGFHLVTEEIERQIDLSGIRKGIAQIFLQHTSASLSISENCEANVRRDMETFFSDLADKDENYYTHTYEGKDDMPAHLKSVMLGTSLSIPVTYGHFNLGAWQGIYLNEHRNSAGARSVVITVMGE